MIDGRVPGATWSFTIKPILDVNFDRDPSQTTEHKKSAGFVLQSDSYSSMNVSVLRLREPKNKFNVDSESEREFIDNGNGGKRLVFKGENGEIARDPENHLEPYTAEALLKKELRAMGILDEGRQASGAGTHQPQQQQQQGGAPVDVSMARTQQEADNIIHNQLNALGLVRGSKKYQEAYDAAWKDNNVINLPVK
jgi:hypothetical protein